MRTAPAIRAALLLVAVHFSAAATSAADAKPGAKRPNIVVIMTDDMGYSDVGCFGSEIPTPNIDKLAAGGVRFTQFYNVGRCCPTRASLLTGLYPHQAGIGHMTGDYGADGYRGELNDRCVTMAQALRPAGYGTYAVGKWHVTGGKNVRPDGDKASWPVQRGFDHFYGTIAGGGNYFDPATLTKDNTMVAAGADPDYKPNQYYYTDAIADHAARFVGQHQKESPDKPLFMYVAFTAAHWPMMAPEADVAKYKGKYDGGYGPTHDARLAKMKELGLIDPAWTPAPMVGDWSAQKDKAWEARCREVYAAMIDRMDQGVGKIVASLKEAGRLDDTLILYLQDNGACQETIGRQDPAPATPKAFPKQSADQVLLAVRPTQLRDGRPVRQGVGAMPGPEDTYVAYGENWANVSNTPFRLYKHYVHEGGISTPLIAHWPKGIARHGDLEKQPGHLIDVMATAVDLAGATYPTEVAGKAIQPMEGKSLVPAFAAKPIDREAIYWEHEGNRAMRAGQWKLVAKGAKGPWELYDMQADRTELHDLAAAQPERTREMVAKWTAWATRTNVLPLPKESIGGGAEVSPPKPAASASNVFKAGTDLPSESAPDIGKRAFTVTAEIEKIGDGVVAAQGGKTAGYALYVKDGRAAFDVRRNGKLTTVVAKNALPAAGPVTVKASLADDGTATLTIGQAVAGTGKAGGTLGKTPADGFQVGQDAGAAVGEYEVPFAFKGTIGKVTVELGERK